MSLRDYLSDAACPSCDGAGTVLVDDAAAHGRVFAVVCSRCGGAGSVRGQLTERIEAARGPSVRDVATVGSGKRGAS